MAPQNASVRAQVRERRGFPRLGVRPHGRRVGAKVGGFGIFRTDARRMRHGLPSVLRVPLLRARLGLRLGVFPIPRNLRETSEELNWRKYPESQSDAGKGNHPENRRMNYAMILGRSMSRRGLHVPRIAGNAVQNHDVHIEHLARVLDEPHTRTIPRRVDSLQGRDFRSMLNIDDEHPGVPRTRRMENRNQRVSAGVQTSRN